MNMLKYESYDIVLNKRKFRDNREKKNGRHKEIRQNRGKKTHFFTSTINGRKAARGRNYHFSRVNININY